jgi:hypothetical protein
MGESRVEGSGNPEKGQGRDAGQPDRSAGSPGEKRQWRDDGQPESSAGPEKPERQPERSEGNPEKRQRRDAGRDAAQQDEARKRQKIQRQLDEALANSFPASDPVSIVTSIEEEDWGAAPDPAAEAKRSPEDAS